MRTIGQPVDNTSVMDGIRMPEGLSHILEVGSSDTIDSAYYNSVNITANVTDVGNDVQVFIADNDVVYVGNSLNFTTLSVALTTSSSSNLGFTYSYCNSTNDWQTLFCY